MSNCYSGAHRPACLTTVQERVNPARIRKQWPGPHCRMGHTGVGRRKGRGSAMWMLKRMRDMKDMLEAAPGMVAQAQQLGAQAQQMAVAQHAAYQTLAAQAAGARLRGAEAGADFGPVAGVPSGEFATVSQVVVAFGVFSSEL